VNQQSRWSGTPVALRLLLRQTFRQAASEKILVGAAFVRELPSILDTPSTPPCACLASFVDTG